MAKKMAASPIRVFEYTADDGTIYWSMIQRGQTVSPPLRLTLTDRKGMMLGQYIGQLRMVALATQQELEEPDAG